MATGTNPPCGAVTVFMVEPYRLVREALRNALAQEPGLDVIGDACDAGAAFEPARRLGPAVVVIDIGPPDLGGIDAACRFKAASDAKIVALSDGADRRLISEMLGIGARAYVTRSSAGTDLVRAIRAAAAGQDYLCPEMAEMIATALRCGRDGGAQPRLSHREREVLRLVAQGVRSPAISDRLCISVSTVEVHRRNMMRKLGLRTVAELTRYAVREGFVPA